MGLSLKKNNFFNSHITSSITKCEKDSNQYCLFMNSQKFSKKEKILVN